MIRLSGVVFATVFVAACAGPNTSLSTLQFSGDALPFPENYQVAAARVVRDRGGEATVARVSYPQQTVGTGIMAPRRWYVCISGLTGRSTRNKLPRVMDVVEQWIDERAGSERFDVVLFFSTEGRRPSVRSGTDSPLCRDAAFEPILAEPPVT